MTCIERLKVVLHMTCLRRVIDTPLVMEMNRERGENNCDIIAYGPHVECLPQQCKTSKQKTKTLHMKTILQSSLTIFLFPTHPLAVLIKSRSITHDHIPILSHAIRKKLSSSMITRLCARIQKAEGENCNLRTGNVDGIVGLWT